MVEQPSPSSGSTAALARSAHARPEGRRLGVIMALYLFGIFMGAIDTGIVTPARTVIQNDLGVGEQAGIWLITIYTLAYAASIPVMGKLADRMGRKRIYLVSITLFGIGSILCGLAQDFGSFPMLIVARAIQAIGGGGILPVATAEFGTEVPPEKRGMALGMVGGVYGIANVFGASAGSLILDIAGSHNWQWIFYVNVPIALAIVGVGVFALPNNRSEQRRPIDGLGIMLLVAMILSLLYGLRSIDFFDLGNSLTSTEVYPYLLGFVVLLPLFVLVERRAADPVMNLGYFSDRGIALTLILSMLTGFIMMGIVFVPQLAENAVRMPSGSGGYFVIILGLASGVGAPLSGKLSDTIGPTKVLALGASVSAVAAAVVVFWLIPSPGMASVITVLVLMGLGLGFLIGAPLNYMMLERTPKAESNSALATLSLVRSLGTTVAPAIMVGFLAHAGLGMQDRLMAVLPTSVKAPVLPYQAELAATLQELEEDETFAEHLDGVDLPDLDTPEAIEIDPGGMGGEELPAHLAESLRTADVTNITERTKALAEYMFERETPARVTEIQEGVQSGLDGVNEGLPELTAASEEMRSALTDMGAQLAEMETALRRMDTGRAELDRGIAGLDQGIAGMNSGAAGLTRAVAGMDRGLAEQRAALAAAERRMAEGGPGGRAVPDGPGGTPPPGATRPTGAPTATPATPGDTTAPSATAAPTAIPRIAPVTCRVPLQRDRDGNAPTENPAVPVTGEGTAGAEPTETSEASDTGEAGTPDAPGGETTDSANEQRDEPTAADSPTQTPTSAPDTGTPTDAPTTAPTETPTSTPTGTPTTAPTAPTATPGPPTTGPRGMPGGDPQAQLAGLREAIARTQAERDVAARQLATLQGRLAQAEAARAEMTTARTELTAARAKLAAGRSELSQARSDLTEGRLEVEAAATKLHDTITAMTALKEAVPGAFLQSRDEYLAQIDALGPELERTFQEGINGGFRDLYLLYGFSCLLTLGLLPFVPKPPRNDGEPGVDGDSSG